VGTILVTGGTGTLGNDLLQAIVDRGHHVRAMTRHPDHAKAPDGVDVVHGDLATGDGLDLAVKGADAVVHAASAPTNSMRIDMEGTRRVVTAAADKGVAHLLYVSIVGIDVIPYSYYRAKFAAEQIVEIGRVPWTIQRLTQFHPFVAFLLGKLSAGPLSVAPMSVPLQPISTADAARCLADALDAGPSGQLPDRGGPRVESFAELAAQWRKANRNSGGVLPVPVPGALARALRSGGATCPDGAVDGRTFEDWLASNR
jgi:uncharacterized protein YbjT (DUF2867 family)